MRIVLIVLITLVLLFGAVFVIGGMLHDKSYAFERSLFVPTVPAEEARESALKRIVHTFFGGSPESVMAALLDLDEHELDPEALDRLSDLIEESRKQGH